MAGRGGLEIIREEQRIVTFMALVGAKDLKMIRGLRCAIGDKAAATKRIETTHLHLPIVKILLAMNRDFIFPG